MIERELIDTVPFSVDARVAIQLGRESISSSLIAIVELVKNAYDADATEVLVRFTGLQTDNPCLIISDNGEGMGREELLGKWMRIGTSHKANNGSSTKRRIRTGAKGLGRLGIDRLCSMLDLYTTTGVAEGILQLEVKWDRYNNTQSSSLDSIKHEIFSIERGSLRNIVDGDKLTFLKELEKGSVYFLSGLKDSWDFKFLKDLKDELALLVSPFSKNIDFRIKLEADLEDVSLNGYVTSEKLLNGAEWKLLSEIDEKGMVTTLIYDQSNKVRYEKSDIPWSDWIKDRQSVPSCGPLSFEVYFMRNTTSKEVDANKFESEAIRNFLKSNQGIRIYRDHFRVKPYGDPSGDGDWLSLAFRRMTNPQGVTRKGWKIGYNQVVGAVFIGRENNPNLVDQTNREGLTEVPAYYDLRAFANKGISILESVIHSDAVAKKSKKPAINVLIEAVDRSKDSYSQVINELKFARENSSELSTIKVLESVESKLAEESLRNDSFREEIQRLEEEKDTMANLASIGILTASFSHEIIAAISLAVSNCDLALGDLDDDLLVSPREKEDKIRHRLSIIKNSISYINSFGSFTIANIRKNKRVRKLINVAEIATTVFSKLEQMLSAKRINIEIINKIEEKKFISAYPIDWESIFANLITNSCWALEDTPGSNRNIRVTLSVPQGATDIQIDFEDSGRGVEAGTEGFIFNAAYSTKRDPKGTFNGTGMGLAIVKTFVEEHTHGSIEYVGSSSLGGAHFRILAPIVGE